MSPREEQAPAVRAALAGAALAVLVLLVQASLFDPTRLHVHGLFNDQAAYLTTAWSLIDEGRFANGIIYPALIDRPELRTYMPGHYLVLAASDLALGRGVLAALAPSLVGFVLCAAGAAWLAARRAGLAAGILAAAFFALFPGSQLWAFTAMAESSFSTAALAALIGFELCPRRWRAAAVPALLALPFLFRETASLLVLVMGARLIVGEGRWRGALGAFAASVLVLGALQAWQVADGKMALPLGWVASGEFNYGSLASTPPEIPLADLPAALGANVARNVALVERQSQALPYDLSTIGGGAVVLATFIALLLGLRRRDDGLALGTGLAGLALFVLTFALYDVANLKYVRGAAFLIAPLAATFATALDPARRLGALRSRPVGLQVIGFAASALALGAFVFGCRRLAETTGKSLRTLDPFTDEGMATLDEVRPPGAHEPVVLIASVHIGATFAVERWPERWCLGPDDERTLLALLERLPITTAVLAPKQKPTVMVDAGFEKAGQVKAMGARWFVWRRRP